MSSHFFNTLISSFQNFQPVFSTRNTYHAPCFHYLCSYAKHVCLYFSNSWYSLCLSEITFITSLFNNSLPLLNINKKEKKSVTLLSIRKSQRNTRIRFSYLVSAPEERYRSGEGCTEAFHTRTS